MTPRVIAVCGKGGVGKTTLSALLTVLLAKGNDEGDEQTRKLLAVDADHAGGLAMALGLPPERTLEDVRQAAMDEVKERAATREGLGQSLEYLVFDALTERGNLALLPIGRPSEKGCFCAVNSTLRRAISQLSQEFDLTLIDAEAGIEQINRDVMRDVDTLLLVADTSAKALRVAETIHQVSQNMDRVEQVGLVLNRIRSADEVDAIAARIDIPIIGRLPDDDTVRRFDAEELSFFDMPDCPARAAAAEVVQSVAPTLRG